DSSWKTLQSGLTWEAQGVLSQGFGWYRQKFFIPQDYQGTSLVLTFASLPSDDDVFVNGVRIGGIAGGYKYGNLLQRTYVVSPKILRYGRSNSLTVRVWGGNLTFIEKGSGLTEGPYTVEMNLYRLAARKQGAESSSEIDIELFDLSDAQRGEPFELVFRFPKEILNNRASQMHYALSDYYGTSIGGGVVAVSAGADSIDRGVVRIDEDLAQIIYLRGRFKAEVAIFDDAGNKLYQSKMDVDHLSFAKRDSQSLPPLPYTEEL